MAKHPYTRPTFDEALKVWKQTLGARGLPGELVWVFDENLCYERDPSKPGAFRLGFQTRFTPPPAEAERIAYKYFIGFDAPVVFYRLGSNAGRSVCLLLCDAWFENKSESEGFIRKDDWLIAFRPGEAAEVEEVTERARWEQRLLRDRPLHDLDFCMALRAVHETLAHGRVLTTYERYALKLLHGWARLFAHPH